MSILFRSLLASSAALVSLAAQAQTAPLTGGMMDSRAAAAAPGQAATAVVPPVVVRPAASTVVRQAGAPAAAAQPVVAQAPTARPVVRQVQAPAAPAPAPAAGPAASQEVADAEVGDVTRLLVAAQADGRRAGGELPMLGAAASRAWQRYLDSFSQPIPEWFGERVREDD